MLLSNDLYEAHITASGGHRDKEGRLVGVTEVLSRTGGLRRSIAQVASRIAALNPSTGASYKSTSFVLTHEGYLMASSGGAEPLNVTLTG